MALRSRQQLQVRVVIACWLVLMRFTSATTSLHQHQLHQPHPGIHVHTFHTLFHSLLAKLALVQAISPIATHLCIVWSVCLSSVYSCTRRSTALDVIWQVNLRGPRTHCAIDGGPDPHGKGKFGGNSYLLPYDSPEASTDQRFRVLPNYFRRLLFALSKHQQNAL